MQEHPIYSNWNLDAVQKQRRVYLAVFIAMIAVSIGWAIHGGVVGFIVHLGLSILFLLLFLRVTRLVLGYSAALLTVIALVILFVPFLSLLVIAILDWKIYGKMLPRLAAVSSTKPQLCSLAIAALVFSVFPPIGFPASICALRDISKSKGKLYGKKCAWVALIISGALLSLIIFGITRGIIESK